MCKHCLFLFLDRLNVFRKQCWPLCHSVPLILLLLRSPEAHISWAKTGMWLVLTLYVDIYCVLNTWPVMHSLMFITEGILGQIHIRSFAHHLVSVAHHNVMLTALIVEIRTDASTHITLPFHLIACLIGDTAKQFIHH